MRISRLTVLIITFSFLCLQRSNSQDIVINEFMSDNEETLEDDDGEYPDWIELYNAGSVTVNLDGYYLTDDDDDLTKWKFPNIEIGSNQFLTIFASGKDKQSGSFIHTNFKISSDGEELILSNSAGIRIDEFDEVDLDDDESYGRLPDGSANKLILHLPTPSSSNNQSNEISFSHPPGFYKKGLELKLEATIADEIYFTLDGSEPSTSSLLYNDNISLEDNTFSPNVWSEIPTTPLQVFLTNPTWQSPGFSVTKANVLRCATFKNNIKTSKTYSNTYVIADDVFDRYDMPVVSLITEGSNFFDDEDGIYVPGIDYDPNDAEWTGNYFRRDEERPIHIEYFDLEGNLGFSQDAGVRLHGGKTRHGAQKSLRMYARSEYGDKYFRYPLLPQKNVDKYKRFLLQTTTGAWGGDSVIKDIVSHEIVRDMNFEKMDYRPVVVFLNGEYWGIHHIRDRLDENYVAYTIGLELDSIEFNSSSNNHFIALLEYLKDNLPIDDEELEIVSQNIDIDAYIDYQIAEMWLNNFDWPANNSKQWRPIKEDGKWRWIFFDIDGGFRDYTYDMMLHNTRNDPGVGWPNSPRSTFIFRTLIENETFQEMFLARYKELIENDFRPEITKAKLFGVVDQYKYEMENHIERWHFPNSLDTWHDDIDSELVTFLENRSCAVKKHIESFFELDNFDVMCEEVEDTVTQPTIMQELTVSPNPNAGQFSIMNGSADRRAIDVILFNSVGKVVYEFNSININPFSGYPFWNHQIIPGVYYLRIQEMETLTTIPIVITPYD